MVGSTRIGPRDCTAATSPDLPSIVFVWDRFGPSHVDRCEAAGLRLRNQFKVVGVEMASHDSAAQSATSTGDGVSIHDANGDRSANFVKRTLLPGRERRSVRPAVCLGKLVKELRSIRPKAIFFCSYEDPVIFFAAAIMRALRVPVFVMQDSKFDDKQRHLIREFGKAIFYLPYVGALVGGQRSAEYLAFLGVPKNRIALGYDAVSLRRVRLLAQSNAAPGGVPHASRHFTIIGRFIREKNLPMALQAYKIYADRHPESLRELHLCGAGDIEPELRAYVERHGLRGVKFRGFLDEAEIARVLASSLALILPSVQETFGLVVNEAIAMGVPILVSSNPGARDILVRTGVNGYVFEPDNAAGLARLLDRLDRDEGEWTELAIGANEFEPFADSEYFAEGVEQLVRAVNPSAFLTQPDAGSEAIRVPGLTPGESAPDGHNKHSESSRSREFIL
jgi:glycosyltransferase involved in cell wall biosynthesis